MSTEELIERCKKGERKAQTILYEKYSQKMLRICYRIVPDKQIAQDLMHDGFILVFTSIGSLRQSDKLESWMGRIMTNLALRYVNQNNSVRVISISDLSENEEPVNEEPLTDLLPLDTLLNMIEKLPEGYRKIFKLSVLDGLSHKEIADMLHIAQHSSSSQFYRAKEQLKKMIIEYRFKMLLFLLLFLIPISFVMFFEKSKRTFSQLKPVPVSAYKPAAHNNLTEEKPSAHEFKVSHVTRKQYAVKESAPIHRDTIMRLAEKEAVDTTDKILPPINNYGNYALKSNEQEKKYNRSSSKNHKWMFAFDGNGGAATSNLLPISLNAPSGSITSPIPSSVNNWEDYYDYLSKYGSEMKDQKEYQDLMKIAKNNTGSIKEKKHHHTPYTMGVLFYRPIDGHWGIETGINYSRLVSDFVTGDNSYIYEKQKLQYIGIPARGTYFFGTFKKFSIYSSFGTTLNIPVSARSTTNYVIDGETDYTKYGNLKPHLQWSIDGGLGLQYRLSHTISIYAEPNLHYYFNDGSGLKTIWNDHPYHFSFPIGVRFTIFH